MALDPFNPFGIGGNTSTGTGTGLPGSFPTGTPDSSTVGDMEIDKLTNNVTRAWNDTFEKVRQLVLDGKSDFTVMPSSTGSPSRPGIPSVPGIPTGVVGPNTSGGSSSYGGYSPSDLDDGLVPWEALGGGSIAYGIGNFLNDITGANAQNQFSLFAGNLDKAFSRSERLASQDYNSAEARLVREFNSAEAEKARKWQEQMENTAVARRMNDLQEAGVNPMLAVAGSGLLGQSGSGFAASSGSTASSSGSSSRTSVASTNSGAVVGNFLKTVGTLIAAFA